MERYTVLKEYSKGGTFGELALSELQPRAAAINSCRSSFFAVIYKEDYDLYVNRFMKRKKEHMYEFFKQIPFM